MQLFFVQIIRSTWLSAQPEAILFKDFRFWALKFLSNLNILL